MKIALLIYAGGVVACTVGAIEDIGSAHYLGQWLFEMFNKFAQSLLWPYWLVMMLMGK